MQIVKNKNIVKCFIKMFVIILLINLNGYAKNNDFEREAIFKNAVSEYSKDNYQRALEIFQELEQTDKVSFELFYGIGNCYYKLNEIGEAIQYWEKAKKLNSSNEDVIFNLKLANVKLQDKVILPKPFFLFKYYNSIRENLNIKYWLNFSGILFFLIIITILIFMNKKRPKGNIAKIITIVRYILIVLFVFVSTMTFNTVKYRNNNEFGIVIVEQIEVKTEPNINESTSFILHEGSKVKILSKFNRNWYKISYFDDKIGWIEVDKIGKI